MEKKRAITAKQLTVGAAVTALTLICLYAASVTSWMHLSLYFLCSVFGYALLCERRYAAAILMYAAVTLLAFLLLPNKVPALFFGVLGGHFGIFFCFMTEKCRSRILRLGAMLLYCSAFTLLGLYLVKPILGYAVSLSAMGFPIRTWLAVLLLELLFFVWAVLYRLVARVYDKRIRPAVGRF